jgi:uncharacterized protein (DUF58 family)
MSVASPPITPAQQQLLAERRKVLSRARRRRIGFWRSLGRSNRLFPRKLVVTREGRWIIGVAVLLGVGAVNTGNNLLYLVLSLLISIISISGILSELNLRGVRVERHHPRELELGAAVVLRASVHNDKKRAALHLEVDEMLDDDELEMRAGYLLHLRAGERGSAFAVARPKRRGPVRTLGLRLSTTYPFGFARKSIVLDEPGHYLVLPSITAVQLSIRGGSGHGEIERSRRVGQGSELRGLRDFRDGDASRDMHWKVSARRGRPIAREWEAEASRVAWVDFVHLAPVGNGGDAALDQACAVVAGVCAALLTSGMAVGLRTLHGAVEPVADPDGGGDHLLAIRRALAWVTPADRPPAAAWPVSDAIWLARVESSAALAAVVDAGGAVAFSAAEGRYADERVQVGFRSRASVSVASAAPTVHVWLDDEGRLSAVETADKASDLPGAA